MLLSLLFKNLLKGFYLFIFWERSERRGKDREINSYQLPLSHPQLGTGLQPRHVPWLGIESATLWLEAGAQSTEPHQPGLFCKSCLRNFSQSESLKEILLYHLLKLKVLLFALDLSSAWKQLLSVVCGGRDSCVFFLHGGVSALFMDLAGPLLP